MENVHLQCSSSLPLLLLLLFAGAAYVSLRRRRHKKINSTNGAKPVVLPPGPWRLPVIGSLHHLLMSRQIVHRALADLARRWDAPVMYLRLGELPAVVVSSPEGAREIMKTHDAAFSTRAMSVTMRRSIGDTVGILFLPYGKQWRHLRGICNFELLGPKRVRSFHPIREEEVARLVAAIAAASRAPGAGDGDGVVDFGKQITGPMTDLVLRCIMGERFRWREEFLETLARALKNATGFAVADLFPSSSLLRAAGGTVREMRVLNAKLFELVDCAIKQHREKKEADGDMDSCMLSTLMRIQKEGDGFHGDLTMPTVKAVVLDMFAGGSESTSTTLEWAMSELVKNPKVMQKAQAEIHQALQGKARVTDDDLLNLKYPKYIIKETLRLHPIAPLLVPKECQESCKILGYDVPKGTIIFVNAWAINRDITYWDNAEMFMPERFEKKMFNFRGTDFEFIPFGAGRRMCPGVTFAHVTIELALTALLYHFDWQLPPGVTPDMLDMEEEFGMTVSRKKHLYLRPILRVAPAATD